ncbi:TRAPP complex subunit Trs33 [Schizosaccharomyces japonicus yFS275]|uniref:TRAPP complex subunit Trs33 n=1 Tax=Schizosaccharomyces japonicus (strain yFS275 / FY16936) TaxID=402676 RepID=B6K2Q9_SCHJY|nr:TRAPP complex subunit Trs33 [Schizosaccharomyces japonicus yFS275]EEB07440.1 TRAPP complex subunit Trs33 [Schizosaccharomyces japonicus yFS275]
MLVPQQFPLSVNASSQDYLLTELIYLAKDFVEEKLGPDTPEEQRDMHTFNFLEAIGFETGKRFTERIMIQHVRLTTTLDMMRFICREAWAIVFKKTIDNLKTNRKVINDSQKPKGMFILTDNSFCWFMRMAQIPETELTKTTAPFLCWPAGFVRGVMQAFGYEVQVAAHCPSLPVAIFQIKVLPREPRLPQGMASLSISDKSSRSYSIFSNSYDYRTRSIASTTSSEKLDTNASQAGTL